MLPLSGRSAGVSRCRRERGTAATRRRSVVESGAAVETTEPIDDPLGRVSAHSDRPTVRTDGEHVSRPPQGRHRHPARVGGEGHVLHFRCGVSSIQSVQVMDGALFGGARRRLYAEDVEVVTLFVGREQQTSRRIKGQEADGLIGVGYEVRHHAVDVFADVHLAFGDAVQVDDGHDARLRSLRRAGRRRHGSLTGKAAGKRFTKLA